MPTTNRGYATPAHGTEVDTWDVPLNDNFGLIDSNLGAVSTVAVSGSNVTLIASEYNCGTIRLSGTLSANILVLFPNVSGWWTIDNQATVGAYYVAARLVAGGNQIGLPPGDAIDVYSDGTNMGYRTLYVPVGGYLDVADAAVPAWVTGSSVPPFLNCDGSTFNQVTYPHLYAKLGTTTLPDLRGRNRVYLDGGTNRVTTAGSGIDGATRFSAGGAQNIALTAGQLAAHSHANSLTDPGHSHTALSFTGSLASGTGNTRITLAGPGSDTVWGGSAGTNAVVTGLVINNAVSGSSEAHINMQPTQVSGISMIRAA